MKATGWFSLGLGVLGMVVALAAGDWAFSSSAAAPSGGDERAQMQELVRQGNYKDAYDGFRKLILDAQADPRQVGDNLTQAVQCLRQLNRVNETDALLEDAVKVHKDNWRLLWSAAQNYVNIQHQGFIVAGRFERGPHRGGGKMVNSFERDRVRALQLMNQARPLALQDDNHGEVGSFLQSLAQMLLANRGYNESWRLQYLTDLNVLPDYEEGWGWGGRGQQTPGAPVDADGRPVFYAVPKSFETAENDGQRWRWCLQQTIEMNPQMKNAIRMQFAQFLRNQFGVQTMAQAGWRFGRMDTDDTDENESGTYALHTLKENETIARLATGIKRFDLPDEFNYIKIYQEIADDPRADYRIEAMQSLAGVFENRRQYPRAAEYWARLIKAFHNDSRRGDWLSRLEQIVGNWGRFEPVQSQADDQGATVEYRFRNSKNVEFSAQEIKVEKLLDDVKSFIKSRPKNLDWQKINIQDIGYRLVTQNETQYLGGEVARWQMPLTPRENHFDRRVTVATPLKTPGAYLVTARMKDGNTSKIIVWIDDTAIVKKPLDGRTFYFVADAASGKPIAKANVEFFGWQQKYYDKPPRHEVITRHFAESTDTAGQLIVDPQQQEQNYQWLITARTPEGRFAYLGFTGVWYGRLYDPEYNITKVFTITDRPVYRPDQKVKYKFWVRHAKYDMEDTSEFAGREFTFVVRNPKNEKIFSQQKRADAYGGIEGEYAIPADATLGVYLIHLIGANSNYHGGNTFRVEEYKKPEYEVSVDAPEKPVMLGDKITAMIKAKYYFGSPVTKAKVKYKITRDTYDDRWYPLGPWDWLYGPGYWWYAYDYAWYPGWRDWGCRRPMPFWWPTRHNPPELIADREVEIGPDGTLKVEIDTGVAKAIHPDCDHSYTITAEVIDASRRTIVGSGRVLVARKPFTVTAWLDRGYYRTGDTIHAHLSARTLDGRPVEGAGKLQLMKISYKDGKPVETPVGAWDVNTNAEGVAQQQMTASEAGQYRVSYKLVSRSRLPSGTAAPDPARQAGPTEIEGGYVFTVIGEGFDGSQFRFNHLELIPDKKEYAPGDKVKLQINTDRVGGTVLLFLRPANGIYLPPEVIRLDGKSIVREVGVVKKDMPNFFVEAVTVAGGRVHCETKEIVVPPEKRILNVEIQPQKLPSPSGRGAGGEGEERKAEGGRGTGDTKIQDPRPKTEADSPHPNPLPEGEGTVAYKPGEKAKVKVKLTDFTGEAFVGSTVVAIYDKSVEYISGGSNTPEIKEFFWKWRRQHHPRTETSLERWFQNLVMPNAVGMSDLGVFGGSVADEMNELSQWDMGTDVGGAPGRAFGGRGSGVRKNGGMLRMKSAASLEKAKGMAMPMAAAAPMADMTQDGAVLSLAKQAGPAGAAPMVEPVVRKNFADTALWVGSLTTAKDGTAEVSLDMPENLTTWRIKVWGMGGGTRVGQGFCDVVTRKDLIIRMEAPRFFVQNDEVVLSAVVHNYLKTKKSVKVGLELDGGCLKAIERRAEHLPASEGQPAPWLERWVEIEQPRIQTVEIAPNGEARVDWRVKVLNEGQATIRMKAITDEESDAMEQTFPCYVHGMAKMDSYSGVIAPSKNSGEFTVNVPEKRRPGESRLEVRWSPTLAGAMVDALPYMVDYPYGCTEQTLNRFLPTVITQKVLLGMKLDLKAIEKKQTNLNAQEIGDDKERAKQWGRLKTNSPHPNPLPRGEGTGANPVFDEDEVRRMVKDGVERLTQMQCSDGGWGWFSGWGEHSTPHTTAVVVHGLQIARQNDVALVPGVLERGVEWLRRYQDEQVRLLKNAPSKTEPYKTRADDMDAFVYMVLADAGVKNAEMCEFLYRDRTHLSVYALAMYGLALEKQAEKEKLAMVVRNIGQYVEEDDENQTAWLNMPQGCWWYWYGSEFEAEAYYLKLLARTDPKGERARRLVKYLLNNRKNATYWNSTRDTSLCIEAMADFIRASGEDKPNMTVELYYDGKLQKAVEITPQNLFMFDNKFVLEGDAVTAGRHTIELKKKGVGPLYYNGYMSYFTLEDFIPRSTSVEVKVDRRYYKLVKADKTVHAAGSRGQAVEQKVEKYERQELKNLAEVKSGDLVEIELVLDSKNDYEYMIFEDMKPAGFEPVDLRSGYTGNDMGAYVEFRDNRVVFFVRQLMRGHHSVAYRMRAEIPGLFSALPTRVWAMYAPELKANSDELKIGVKD